MKKMYNLESKANFIRNSLLVGVMSLFMGVCGYAQEPEKTEYVWKQGTIPYGIENYMFAVYYYNADKVYNLRSVPLASVADKVECMKVNPAGLPLPLFGQKGGRDMLRYTICGKKIVCCIVLRKWIPL